MRLDCSHYHASGQLVSRGCESSHLSATRSIIIGGLLGVYLFRAVCYLILLVVVSGSRLFLTSVRGSSSKGGAWRFSVFVCGQRVARALTYRGFFRVVCVVVLTRYCRIVFHRRESSQGALTSVLHYHGYVVPYPSGSGFFYLYLARGVF